MASLWELESGVEALNLDYAKDAIGAFYPEGWDLGGGPPIKEPGWLRSVTMPTTDNCFAFTSSDVADRADVFFLYGYVQAGSGGTRTCDHPQRIWCMQD